MKTEHPKEIAARVPIAPVDREGEAAAGPGMGSALVLEQVTAGKITLPPHTRTRFLMGALPQGALPQVIRSFCIPADLDRVPEVNRAWGAASARMTALAAFEAGLADRIVVSDPPASVQKHLGEIAADTMFVATFSGVPISFKVVDIDLLVAPQRELNMEHVERMFARIPGKSVEELIDYCLGPARDIPEVKSMQTMPNQVTYSSKCVDLRFTGGTRKPITDADLAVAYSGGQPVEAVSLLAGFGAAQINVFMVGNRVVLNNGFHRVAALRMAGVTKVPVVVQHISNLEIEFPGQVAGTPKAYLLNHQRPVLIKDFFDEQLTVELRLIPRRKVVRVTWNVEEFLTAD